MKILTLLKFSLLVVCLYTLILIVGFIFNINYLLLASINTLTPVKISNASEFHISYKPFLIHFDQLDFKYQHTSFEIKKGDILLDTNYFKPSISSIKFDELKVLELKDTENLKIKKRTSFKIKDYSPSVFFKAYKGINISIRKLTYQQSDTKVIAINNLLFETRDEDETPYLYISLSLPNFYEQTLEVNSKIQSNDKAEFNIRNYQGTDITTQIAFEFLEDNQTKVYGSINATYGPRLAKPLNDYIFHKELLKSMQGSLSMTFSSITNNDLDFTEALAAQIHEIEAVVSSEQSFSFNQSVISNLQAKANFSTKLKSNGEVFNASIIIPENLILSTKFNEQHSYFSGSKTLSYLSKQNLKLIVPASETNFLTNNHFTLPNAITFNWSQTGNPAYLDLKLEQAQGNMKQGEIENLKIDYSLTGRWNRFFSSEHTNSIQLSNITPGKDFTISMKGMDKRLHTDFNIKAEKKGDDLNGNLSFSTNNWKQEVKYLNEVMAFWNKDIQFIEGDLELKSDFSAKKITSAEMLNISYFGNIKVKQLDVDNDGFIYNNISFVTKFKGNNKRLDCTEPFPIQIPYIHAGFIIKNLSVNANCHFDLNADSYMDFSSLNASLFGGALVGDDFRLFIPYNANHEIDQPYHASMTAHVTNIQLREVLAVMDNPEIQGDGPLYGDLPIRFNEQSTVIENGWIKNKTPGVLSYKPNNQTKALLRQNPQMKLMVDVLGHLDYTKLNANINLNNKGTLSIQGELMGVNKKYKSGAPISFNPNIELDFTDLIKSLQISDNISQSLDNKVNEKKLD